MRSLLLVTILLVSADVGAAQEEKRPAEPLFEDVTKPAGLKGLNAFRVSFADINGDGWPDTVIGRSKILLNKPSPNPKSSGKRQFRPVDYDKFLQPEGMRGADGVQFGDVDNDGDLDLFYVRNTDLSKKDFKDDGLRCEIWLNDGTGKFAIQKDSGVGAEAETTGSACFVDVNRDGILDLFVGNAYVAYGKSLEAFPDRLYLGKGDGSFEDVTEEAGLLGVAEIGKSDSRRPTYGVAHTDWNNDGWQDLLVCTYGRQWNRLWKNNGDGTFTDVGAETTFDGDADRSGKYPERKAKETENRADEPPFRSNGNTFDAAVADYDGDGDMDCFLGEITHWWGGPSSDFSSLLINLGEKEGWKFRRAPELITRFHDGEDWNQGDLHAGWLDVDNDGRLDLLIASTDYPDLQLLRLYRQKEDHTFEEQTDRLGFRWVNASQISLADYDRDGATDILVGTTDHRMTEEQKKAHDMSVGLFRNLCAERAGNRFLNLRLSGGGKGKANRMAVGARVTIWIGKERQVREVYGGLGHACHRDDTDCRFGVGKAEKVDKIEVRWPDADGTIQTFENVATNRFYTLEQGGKLGDGR